MSDDAVIVATVDDTARVCAAPNIFGKIEMRGVGIVERPWTNDAPLRLVVMLDAAPERLPPINDSHYVSGFDIASLALNAFEESAVLKVEQRLKSVVDADMMPVAVQPASP